MRGARHIFAQVPKTDGVEQIARIGGATTPVYESFPASWAHMPSLSTERLKRVVGLSLRWSARSIYLSPALLVLRLGPSEVGDAGVVIVVGLGVLFFSLLNTFILLIFLSWRARKHRPPTPSLRWPFSRNGDDVLGLLKGGTPAGKSVRPDQLISVRGTVRGLHGVPRGAPVLDDFWWLEARLTEATDFMIDRDPPVLIEFEAAPVLLGRPERVPSDAISVSPAAELLPTRPASACQHVQLCDGDEVELVGTVAHLVDDILAAGAPEDGRDPYRGAASRTGIVVRSSFDRPACLRVVRRGLT